jgi:hypothetical protein
MALEVQLNHQVLDLQHLLYRPLVQMVQLVLPVPVIPDLL